MEESIIVTVNDKEYPANVSFEYNDEGVTDINWIHILVNDDFQDISFLIDDLREDIAEDLEEKMRE